MKKWYYIIMLFALVSCQRGTYIPVQRVDSEMKACYIRFEGQYYDSIPCNVLSLDLYSNGLDLDSTEHMHGTGTNLYLSDVFIPLTDSMLPAGQYTAARTGEAMTFLPGMDFEGNPTGTYILLVAEDKVTSITLCTDSTMTVAYEGDTLDLQFRLQKPDKRIYKAHYRGNKPHPTSPQGRR